MIKCFFIIPDWHYFLGNFALAGQVLLRLKKSDPTELLTWSVVKEMNLRWMEKELRTIGPKHKLQTLEPCVWISQMADLFGLIFKLTT